LFRNLVSSPQQNALWGESCDVGQTMPQGLNCSETCFFPTTECVVGKIIEF
jgi:hypothetical protein